MPSADLLQSQGTFCTPPARAGMPMHLVTSMGVPGSPEERFIDVFRGGQLLTRCWILNFHRFPIK